MKETLKLNECGYICSWLVTEPKEEPYHPDFFLTNQLQFEKKLRGMIADDALKAPPAEIKLGAPAFENYKWTYYNGGTNWFLDLSKFYFTLAKVEYWAASGLVAEKDCVIPARVWSYEAVDLWLNGEKVCSIKEPVYKPIKWQDVQLHLHAGTNEIFARLQDLGVRDTRNIFGIQLLKDYEGITVTLPDAENSIPVALAQKWLLEITYENGALHSKTPPVAPVATPAGVWSEGTDFPCKVETADLEPSITLNGQTVSRKLELPENIKMTVTPASGLEENRKNILDRMAKQMAHSKADINGILLHYYLGTVTEEDYENLDLVLHKIDIREDCADFALGGAIRLAAVYQDVLPEAVKEKIKNSALNFRYWMDEEGADGMCFWSENHAIMFHFCQLCAGRLYPDELFPRSGRTGRQQYEMGLARCREWLDSVEATGFEEFLSPGYMTATAAALMGVVDYADEETSARAAKVLDRELEMLAMHSFKETMIGPRGRIYRDVIRPMGHGILAFRKWVDPSASDTYAPWLITALTSKYHFDESMAQLAKKPQDITYPNGNTEISLYKTDDCILSSVASPVREGFRGGWSHESAGDEDPYVNGSFTYMYVKALNERYHGTTRIQPGVFGYQQHLWSAALSTTCHVFTNLPGLTIDEATNRPGYWFGNGTFPALRQEKNKVSVVYNIEDTFPVKFTHLYWPESEFDSTEVQGSWRFGRCGTGYLGVWCSGEQTPFNNKLMNCELRCYDRVQAYVCRVSGQQEETYEQFKAKCLADAPVLNANTMTLTDAEGSSLTWKKYINNTQAI